MINNRLETAFSTQIALATTLVLLMASGCSDNNSAPRVEIDTTPVVTSETNIPTEVSTSPSVPLAAPSTVPLRSSGRENIKFTHFQVGNRNVKSMLADGDILWIGTSGGVIRYDTKIDDFKVYDVRSGKVLSNGIFHLSKHANKLYIGTYGGGLSVLNIETEEWKEYNIQHGLADGFIYDVEMMDNGDLWIATWSGANRIIGGDLDDFKKWETYTVANTQGGLPNDWVYGLAKGKDGVLWLATEGGLARFVAGKWDTWKHADGLGAPYDLVKDEIKFTRDPAEVSSHHARQKIEMGLTDVTVAYNPNYIVSLHVDDLGVVWAGTWGGGLTRFDGDKWSYFTMKDGLPANHIFMLGPEKHGRLWVGTSDGLARFDGNKFTVFTVHDGLYTNNIFSMTNADDGSLWLGGFGGVTRLIGLDAVE